ncbi:MAG: hypothetical protein ACRDRI_02065 [Pseudonocardiaceae bacterium]
MKWPWVVFAAFVLLLAMSGPATTFGDGIHIVGADIFPGTYRTTGPTPGGSGCDWKRLKEIDGNPDSIIERNPEKFTVVILDSDRAFETSGCNTWRKIG